jgi:molybdate transport system substrate-binding protein
MTRLKSMITAGMAFLFSATAPALAQTPPQEPNKAPLIFAAASMKTALDQIATAWKAKTGKSVAISYASSAVLAKQIEAGAPADLFISADLKWMDYLDEAGLLRPRTRETLLGNQLVLVAPADAKTTVAIAKGFDLAGAIGSGKLAVCTISSCPAGLYGKEALEKLGVWAAIEPKLAQADNVRGALLLVARGEATLGIVYATDAKAEPKVKVVGIFPESSHEPIVYPAAIPKESKNPDAAALEHYLSAPESIKIFEEQGFTIIGKPPA